MVFKDIRLVFGDPGEQDDIDVIADVVGVAMLVGLPADGPLRTLLYDTLRSWREAPERKWHHAVDDAGRVRFTWRRCVDDLEIALLAAG